MRFRLATILMLAAPVASFAQHVSGTVRVADGPNYLSGVVLTTVDPAGHSLARTLSDASGRYSLPVGEAAVRVRAVRIGFKPVTMNLDRRAGEIELNVVMERIPIVLATVQVASDATCSNGGNGRVVLDTWEQARTALLAAIVAREARPARVQILEYQRRMELKRHLVLDQRLTHRSAVSSRPIAAARASSDLAMRGYRAQENDGDVYFAPDADVLFDESFGEAHCFSLLRGTGGRAGQLGLAFRARRAKRDFVDVEGVLWIRDRPTELVDLEYHYTGLGTPETVGGAMRFRTMTNGVVFIDSWSMVVPTMTEVRQRGYDGNVSTSSVVKDLVETGAFVTSATWPDGTVWSDPVGGIRGTVRIQGSRTPMDGVVVSAGGGAVQTNAAGEYSLMPLPPGRYRLTLVDSAFVGYVEARAQSHEVVVARGDTVTANFELASRESVVGELCRGDRSGVVLLGKIDDGNGPLPDKLQVRASWVSGASGAGTVDLSRLSAATRTSTVDPSGRFYVCGVPTQTSVTLALTANRVPVSDTTIAPSMLHAPTATRAEIVEWTISSTAIGGATRGDGATLRGRVLRDGNPIAGAQVWVVFPDTTVTTDSLGRYRVGGLRAGLQMVQVRRIGYAVRRDTVLLRGREETVRDFVMDGAQLLDTVRSVGAGRAYDAPRLQEFEKRRLGGMGGRFISEDELRSHEGRSMADILRTYIPGVTLESYGGQLLLSSSSTPTMTQKGLPNGPRGCWVSVFLDGIAIYRGEPNSAPPDMRQFLAMNLSGVEYYGSAANLPLQFKSSTNNCGTLLLWTRGK
jgi:hypothetical protein